MEPKKRKISIRKLLQAIVTLLVTTGGILAVSSASSSQEQQQIREIHLHVENEQDYAFLDRHELWQQVFDANGIKPHGVNIAELPQQELEAAAAAHPWVASAQVYLDGKYDLHLSVKQHIPAARVFFRNGTSKYIDSSLNELPLSASFSYYTTLVTNVPHLDDDSARKSLYAQILAWVDYIDQDSFWSAQVASISVRDNGGFELYPLVGKHIVLLGDSSRIPEKLNYLFGFYKSVLNHIGWDKYDRIDLRYKGQLVASPELKWKKPPANAMSNMNWLDNIMSEAGLAVPADQAFSGSPVNKAPVQNNSAEPVKTAASKPAVTVKNNPPPGGNKPVSPEKPKPPAKAEDRKKTETNKSNKKQEAPKYIYSN